MTRPATTLLLVCLLAASSFSQTSPDITAADIRTHIQYLASDELGGRASGSEGNRKAAEYIAAQMKRFGLSPAGDNGTFFQTFEFVSSVRLGEHNSLVFKGESVPGKDLELKADKDFRPFGFSSSTTVSGALVFVGYGIAAPDNNYDDYKGIDVAGKVVVALRFSPDGTSAMSSFSKFSSFRNKARVARDKGAAAIIIVSSPADEAEDEIIPLSSDRSFEDSGIPALSMKRAPFEAMLQAARGVSLKAIQDSIKSSKKPSSMEMPGISVELTTSVTQVKARTSNIIGMLEGRDERIKDQVVVLGAHMDHLGLGGPGSGSLQPDTVAVHHGADDNASGSAGLLELEEAFGARREHLGRTLLFIAFSGEELGTLGSGYYVNHPVVPLERTVAMINMDMIGRLDNKTLTVYGTGSSPVWMRLLNEYDRDSTFTLNSIPDGFGPSDQAEFYGKDMPVLHFFTGTHNDYHKPSDTWDKINYAGEEQVVKYVYNLARDVDTLSDRPAFVKTQSAAVASSGDSRSFSVTLGIVPDFSGGSTSGMRIGGVRPKGPAERAGLKSGDVIVKMAGKKVMNIYDYMGLLGELKAGDIVDVEVLRDGKPLTVSATMDRRK